ncbi:MAG: S41 family peptidase [Bacteroidota bacterium]
MIRLLIVCFAFLGMGILLNAQTQVLSPEDLQTDIAYLQKALYKSHPSIFRYSDRQSMNRQFEALQQLAQSPMSMVEFEYQIRKLLCQVGCIHTTPSRKVKRRKKTKGEKKPVYFLPYGFYTDGEALWISRKLNDSLPDLNGFQVLSIEGQSDTAILNQLLQHQSADGYNQTFAQRLLNYREFFNLLYAKYIQSDKERYKAILQGPQGRRFKADLPGIEAISPPKKEEKEQVPVWTHQMKNHYFRLDTTAGYGLIDINAFNPYRFRTLRFYKRSFKKMTAHPDYPLIIDLRDNLGGSIDEAEKLLSYIMDEPVRYTLEKKKNAIFKYSTLLGKFYLFADFLNRRVFNLRGRYRNEKGIVLKSKKRDKKRHNFDGQVYVITNGFSASSASFAASFLKHKAQAIVIGQESGGGAAGNNGLLYPSIRLPRSRIQVKMPQYWVNYQLIEDEGRGVAIDFPVQYEIEDILLERDLEIELILEQIQKN